MVNAWYHFTVVYLQAFTLNAINTKHMMQKLGYSHWGSLGLHTSAHSTGTTHALDST